MCIQSHLAAIISRRFGKASSKLNFNDASKAESWKNRVITIEIQTHHLPQSVWRLAKLTITTSIEVNLVSPKLLDAINVDRPSADEGSLDYALTFDGQIFEIQGYVNLVWGPLNSRLPYGPSQFAITTAYDPPFDAVLGNKDSIFHGLT